MRRRHQKSARQQMQRAAGYRTERSLMDCFAPILSPHADPRLLRAWRDSGIRVAELSDWPSKSRRNGSK